MYHDFLTIKFHLEFAEIENSLDSVLVEKAMLKRKIGNEGNRMCLATAKKQNMTK